MNILVDIWNGIKIIAVCMVCAEFVARFLLN